MAAVKSEPGVCPDCLKWSRKYSKVDGARNALREAVKILQVRVDELMQENSALNKVVEEARSLADSEKEARAKENHARAAFEKEIAALKSELLSLQENRVTETSDTAQEVSRLQTCVSESEKEIVRLKELVEKEKLRAETALENLRVEKTKAGEASKAAKSEKSRAEKEKRRAFTESGKAQEYKNQLDALRSEVAEVNSQLTLAITKCEEANTRLEAEGKRALAEKKRADLEKAEADKQKNIVEAYERKLAEEKHIANTLSCQLEVERKKNEEMLNKINELLSSKTTEDCSAQIDKCGGTVTLINQHGTDKNNELSDKMDAEAERKKKCELVNEKRVMEDRVDRLFLMLEDEKRKNHELQSIITKLKEANDVSNIKSNGAEGLMKQLEVEKEKTIMERRRANMLKAEANLKEKKLKEEMSRANELSCQLEEEKKKNKELQKKIVKLVASNGSLIANNALNDKDASVDELTTNAKTNKKKTDRDIKRCSSRAAKLEEQKGLMAPPDRIKTMEEKQHADQLTHSLHDKGQTIETSRNQLLSHSQNMLIPIEEVKCVTPHKSRNCDGLVLKLSREKTKIAKAHLKHVKREVKFERVRSSILMKELDILREEFVQFSNRLDFLDYSLSCKAKGANVTDKVQCDPCFRWKERKLLDFQCRNSLCGTNQRSNHVSQPLKPALFPPFSGIKLAESTSGTDSKLDPPAGSSDEDLYDGSAINSSRASFSDRRIMDVQEIFGSSTTSSNLPDGISLKRSDSRLCGEVTGLVHSINPPMVTDNVVRSYANAPSGEKPAHDKKRKRILSLIDSVQYTFSESKKLQMQLEENVSILHNELRNSVDTSKRMFCHDQLGRSNELCKKRKVSHKQKVSSPCLLDEEHFAEPDASKLDGATVGLDMSSLPPITNNDVSNGALVCQVSNAVLSAGNGDKPTECFDHLTHEDFTSMTLLNLDDYEEEKRYRVARDNLLSPSLPEIEFQSGDAFSVEDVNLTFNDESSEMNSRTTHRSLLQEDDKTVACFKTSECITTEADISNLEACCTISSLETLHSEDLANLFVVHSEIVDHDNLARIFYATRNGASLCHSSSSPGVLLKSILSYIDHEDLPTKDKVCIFFSVLLAGCHVTAMRELSSPVRDSTVILNSYMADLISAIKDIETVNCMKQTLSLLELLNLIEEFIMNGRIWVSLALDGNPSAAGDSSLLIPLGNKMLTLKAASTEQLLVASFILASLSVALDDIDFIHRLSYNLFRFHKYNYTVVLSVVHVFAQVVGREFLTSTSNSLLTSVVKSVVVFLESSHSPCSKCPFSEVVSLDAVLSGLFKRLQHLMENAKTNISSSGSLEEITNPEISDIQSSSALEETFSQFVDVLSLVELIANNLSWDIISCQVVPRLLSMLGTSVMDIFSMAIVVCLGQLGRLGISANGPEDISVDRIRCQLTALLGCDKSRKVMLPAQIAIVCSLLGLLDFDLNSLHLSADLNPSMSEDSTASQVRRWFTSLNKQQHSFSMDILRDAFQCR